MTAVIGPAVVVGPQTATGGPVLVVADSVTETELTEALAPYATVTYVDAAVATGGDVSGVQALIDDSVTAHALDPTPHPEYDDLPSLSLLFRNRLV